MVTQTISESAARETTDLLVAAVRGGQAKLAALPGYAVAGQSGAAAIAESGRYGGKYLPGFAGFFPAGKYDQPRVVIAVFVRDPKGFGKRTPTGTLIAGMVFRSVATQLIGC